MGIIAQATYSYSPLGFNSPAGIAAATTIHSTYGTVPLSLVPSEFQGVNDAQRPLSFPSGLGQGLGFWVLRSFESVTDFSYWLNPRDLLAFVFEHPLLSYILLAGLPFSDFISSAHERCFFVQDWIEMA